MTEADYQARIAGLEPALAWAIRNRIARLEYELAWAIRNKHDSFTGAALQNPLFFTDRDLESPRGIALRARRIADACMRTQPEVPPKPKGE